MIRETIFVMHSQTVQQMYAILEELITDDSSASVHEIDREDYRTRIGDVAYRIRIGYDGQRYEIRVREHVASLKSVEMPAAEVAFLRPAREPPRQVSFRDAGTPLSSRQKAQVHKPTPTIDWTQTDIYQAAGEPAFAIASMRDQFLWEIITWMTRNRDFLFGEEIKANREPIPNNHSLVACLWLRDRPLYRAMVKESIRRFLTFPPDVYRVLKDYVLDRKNTLDNYEPWHDPNHEHEAKSLQPFLFHPTIPEDEEGKERRSIEI